MIGYKFYLEYPSTKDKNKGTRKELGNHEGNCIAISWNDYRITNDGVMYDGITAINYVRNSYVSSANVHEGYLKTRCKRISEAQARLIHPNLFEALK